MPELEARETFAVKGKVQIWSRPAGDGPPFKDGPGSEQFSPIYSGWDLEYETDNLVVDAGKVLMARMMAEDTGFDTGVTFCEVGTNATAPTAGDTDIGTVTKRNAITRYVRIANRVQFRTFFAAGDISVALKAIGLYGHSTATATDQTGELFNHAKIDFDNSAGTKDLTTLLEVTFG